MTSTTCSINDTTITNALKDSNINHSRNRINNEKNEADSQEELLRIKPNLKMVEVILPKHCQFNGLCRDQQRKNTSACENHTRNALVNT